MIKFSLKLGETMRREDQMDLALAEVMKAASYDVELTKTWIEKMGFSGWAMEAFK
jgi:2C-methyl-D-erythritol 2,4-cyclodiphosphate synthase